MLHECLSLPSVKPCRLGKTQNRFARNMATNRTKRQTNMRQSTADKRSSTYIPAMLHQYAPQLTCCSQNDRRHRFCTAVFTGNAIQFLEKISKGSSGRTCDNRCHFHHDTRCNSTDSTALSSDTSFS